MSLVVASVDWKSKAVSNKPFRTLRLDRIKSKMPFTFQLIVGSKQVHQKKPQRFWLTFGLQMPFQIMDPTHTSQSAFPYWQRVRSHDLKFNITSSL
jgi:hypothetical protein